MLALRRLVALGLLSEQRVGGRVSFVAGTSWTPCRTDAPGARGSPTERSRAVSNGATRPRTPIPAVLQNRCLEPKLEALGGGGGIRTLGRGVTPTTVFEND